MNHKKMDKLDFIKIKNYSLKDTVQKKKQAKDC